MISYRHTDGSGRQRRGPWAVAPPGLCKASHGVAPTACLTCRQVTNKARNRGMAWSRNPALIHLWLQNTSRVGSHAAGRYCSSLLESRKHQARRHTAMECVPPKKAGLGRTWKNSPHTAHFFIRCLPSELSIPWDREQTDRMTQVITEAGPRYQSKQ